MPIFPSWHPIFGSHYTLGVSNWHKLPEKKVRKEKRQKGQNLTLKLEKVDFKIEKRVN